jgi:hypothetical protein
MLEAGELWMPAVIYKRIRGEPYNEETKKQLWTGGSRGGSQEM